MDGSWFGLVLACGAAALLNALILASTVWTEWLHGSLVTVGWAAVVAIWGTSWYVSTRRQTAHDQQPAEASQADPLLAVQRHYLQGDWYQAEALLKQVLADNQADIEARLMLATLKRHAERYDEALSDLQALQQLEAAEPWQHEINAERALLAKQSAEAEPLEDHDENENEKLPTEPVTLG